MKYTTELICMDDPNEIIGGKKVHLINPPLYEGSTVLFDCYEDMAMAMEGKYPGVTYGTSRLPNQRAFEQAMERLEGGYITRTFQSGISAIAHVFMAFTQAGDHVLICENVYGPTARFCKQILSKFQIETGFIPSAVGEDVSDYIQPNTRLIFLESPGSNTFEIQDIQAITAIAGQHHIITVLDNTWATPLYLKPFDLGIDVSIQSVTKYISGHSDVLLGTVSVNEAHWEAFDHYYHTMELFAPSRECALALRGLKTLAIRLKHHETSGLAIARWLESMDLVDQVFHPALESHPQHHLWKRYFSGASGLFAFTFRETYSQERLTRFANTLKLFGLGYSWGGYKSLITIGRYKRSGFPYSGKPVVRLNIGLEDPQDLKMDLQQAFRTLLT